MKTLILVNPKAREGEVGRQWPELERQLLGALGNGDAQVEFTSAVDHGAAAVRRALQGGSQRVLAVGGDGTISEALQGFFDLEGKLIRSGDHAAVLAIMPAGRGDDFFKSVTGQRSLSSSAAWEQGLELLKHGKPEPIDVGRVSWLGENPDASWGRAWINIASFGFASLVVNRVLSRSGALSRSVVGKSALTYLTQSIAALSEYEPIEIEVRANGEVVYDGPVFSGFVMNGRYNGGGMCWSNEARIDDGELNLLVLEPRDLFSSVLGAPKMASGDWKGAKGAHVAKGSRIVVRAHDRKTRDYPLFEIDGDQPERPGTEGAVFEVLSGAVQLWK